MKRHASAAGQQNEEKKNRDCPVHFDLSFATKLDNRVSGPPHVSAGACVDPESFAFLDEERDVDGLSGLEPGRLGHITGGVAPQPFGRLNDLEVDGRRQINLDRFAFGIENLHRKIFHEIIFRVTDQIFLQCDRIVRFRVHKMEPVVVLITEVQVLSFDIDQLNLVGRTEPDVGAFAGVDVANDRLHKRTQISRRAMVHFEHDGSVAVVFNRHSFAEIVRCSHF
jgi:hypothetical protein